MKKAVQNEMRKSIQNTFRILNEDMSVSSSQLSDTQTNNSTDKDLPSSSSFLLSKDKDLQPLSLDEEPENVPVHNETPLQKSMPVKPMIPQKETKPNSDEVVIVRANSDTNKMPNSQPSKEHIKVSTEPMKETVDPKKVTIQSVKEDKSEDKIESNIEDCSDEDFERHQCQYCSFKSFYTSEVWLNGQKMHANEMPKFEILKPSLEQVIMSLIVEQNFDIRSELNSIKEENGVRSDHCKKKNVLIVKHLDNLTNVLRSLLNKVDILSNTITAASSRAENEEE